MNGLVAGCLGAFWGGAAGAMGEVEELYYFADRDCSFNDLLEDSR